MFCSCFLLKVRGPYVEPFIIEHEPTIIRLTPDVFELPAYFVLAR